MKKAIAEFIGTFALVLIGCGTAVIAGMGTGATSVDVLGIATAFGLTIVAMAYGIGQVSGCHINPAVSFGALVAGRMSGSDFVSYVIAQILGAIGGAVVLYLILSGKASGWSGGLGQNGWGPGYLGEYNLTAAFLYEVIGTFLFLVCILGVTQKGAPVGLAGLAIGLTLVALHLLGINITGTSVNPARSLGPAIVGYGSNPQALHQVWLFILAPLLGAGIAGYLFKSGVLAADDVVPVRGAGESDVAPGASAPAEPMASAARLASAAAAPGGKDWAADVRRYAPDADERTIAGIVRYLGIALQKRDSSLVAFSDKSELDRVRSSFLQKKLALTHPEPVLDEAIMAVGETMKRDRAKNRVTVYYLLADRFDKLSMFG
jgi:aquaporin Z